MAQHEATLYSTEQPRTSPPPAPTCINAFSLTSVPTFLLANLDA